MRKPIVGFWCILIVDAVLLQVNSENCDGEIENALRKLLSPSEYPTLQLRALRRQLLHKMQQALEKFEEEEDPNLKSSLSALARWNNLPEKRNLESLARAGYIKTLPDVEDANDSFKRSIANLAKNGQLPHHDDKRGIQSLARNGEIHTKPTSRQDQLDEELYKRNVASLARSYNFPVFNQKRSLSSLARAGDLPNFYKRNIAALARDGALGKRLEDSYFTEDGTENIKRNIASIKAQYNPKFKRSASRTKREIDYDNLEYSSPVYQNTNVFDYEEMIKELTGEYPEPEKRFLGSVARTGWFRPATSRMSRYNSPDKRHIGSLARLGWLPIRRYERGFNRSGRSTNLDECRALTADGEAEIDSFAKSTFPLNIPINNLMVRSHPRHPNAL